MNFKNLLVKLESPRAWRWGIWAGILVALPSLLGGFFLDDYVNLLTLDGKVHMATPNELFQFATGDPVKVQEYMNTGPFPWFVLLDLKIKFMRPLTSLLMRMDYVLFGRQAWAYHLVCIIGYLMCLLAARGLFRIILPGSLGALTLMLFALNVGHMTAVIWWSNWNAVVATAPALAGLLAHVYWRERGWIPGLPLSLLGYALGLAGGETGLGVFGYLFAYELLAARGGYLTRFGALVPAGCVGLAYVIIYKAMGYGVHGSGLYIDPTHDLLEYLYWMPSHLILLAGTQLFMLPAEAAILLKSLYWPLTVLGAVGIAVLGWLFVPAWRNLETEEKRHTNWLGMGCLISTLPVLATFPSIRLLMLPSLGASVLLAVLLRHLYREGWETLPRWQRGVGFGLMAIHFVVGPLVWVVAPISLRGVDVYLAKIYEEAEFDHAKTAELRFIVLHAQDPLVGFYTMVRSDYAGQPLPKSWWCMTLAPYAHVFTRTGEKTFEMEVIDGEMLATNYEGLIRGPRFPMHVGEVVKIDGMRVTVLEMGEIGPKKIGVELDKILEDKEYCFLTWKDHALRAVALPGVGGTLQLEKQTPF